MMPNIAEDLARLETQKIVDICLLESKISLIALRNITNLIRMVSYLVSDPALKQPLCKRKRRK